ncbi:hypothetical protein [Prochlorococcus marinus]|nr:hypothetical protein [Prochlorococcus marinus]
MDTLLFWTSQQKKCLQETFKDLEAKPWSYELPVFLLNRCWLRLEKITVMELAERLPTDNSRESPELIFYDQLLKVGYDSIFAMQLCWKEFGMEDFHRALRNSWRWKDRGNNGWTFKKYVALIEQYRANIDNSLIAIPLIVLARQDLKDRHELTWLNPKDCS